jgi:hypothetical protein
METATIMEYADARATTYRIDRDKGIIFGVKLLGLESRNGNSYQPAALKSAAHLYENAKVNLNHQDKAELGKPRDYEARMGSIKNVTYSEGQGLFGDFHFNPKHRLAEQLLWDAEHSPGNLGFSPVHDVKFRRDGGRRVVEAIHKVISVDLVADPAATRGLYEATGVATATFEEAFIPDPKKYASTLRGLGGDPKRYAAALRS